ncbi:unnamed protein product, partial [Ectocarpus sp. 12 AP-2014]
PLLGRFRFVLLCGRQGGEGCYPRDQRHAACSCPSRRRRRSGGRRHSSLPVVSISAFLALSRSQRNTGGVFCRLAFLIGTGAVAAGSSEPSATLKGWHDLSDHFSMRWLPSPL